MSDGELQVYVYQGNEGERVPETVEKLIFIDSVKDFPVSLCKENEHLREISLPSELNMIRNYAFFGCLKLLEIIIVCKVRVIEEEAFRDCGDLRKVEFEFSTSKRHLLQRIGQKAFERCHRLHTCKLPSSVKVVGKSAFHSCYSLIEANLSTTCIKEISDGTFHDCSALQTVSLPNTLERIGVIAFGSCFELVTVAVPFDSQPISIGYCAFLKCAKLANLFLPKGSTATFNDSFLGCDWLYEQYGKDATLIVGSLVGRFEDYPVHRMCYDQKRTSVEELRQCIAGQHDGGPLVDKFGMSPFHILLSSPEPRLQLLKVLLDHYPRQLLSFKDANGKRALDYLITNWTDGTVNLLQPILQKLILDPLVKWRCKLWLEDMETKVGALLFAAQFKDDKQRAKDDKKKRLNALDGIYSAFEQYEKIESTSILELALWKCKLKSGRSNDGAKRQVLDRVQCRCVCGSDVLIPNVTVFLYG